MSAAEWEAQEMKLRRRSLGNIRFIGELYKISMLNGRIMHECIRKLLLTTDEESLECLCRLVTTVGKVKYFYEHFQFHSINCLFLQILEAETATVLAKQMKQTALCFLNVTA